MTYSRRWWNPAGAFGSKDEFQSLQNDLNAMEKSRHVVADRMDALSTAKENELGHLRAELRNAQATISAAPPKKVVVDDTEPEKKPPVKKKGRPQACQARDAACSGSGDNPSPTIVLELFRLCESCSRNSRLPPGATAPPSRNSAGRLRGLYRCEHEFGVPKSF